MSQTKFHAQVMMATGRIMRDPKIYFVYIMSNRSKTLYTGVTNSHTAGAGT